MERRDLLKLGAAGVLSGCATSHGPVSFRAVPPPPVWTPEAVGSALGDMDATLAKLGALKPEPAMFGLKGLEPMRSARAHDLIMRMLASMHIAQTFRELPNDVQNREDVQRRMWSALPMMDSAVLDMTEYLTSLPRAERRLISQKLRTEPSLGMDVLGALDEHASAAGIPSRRRLHMRAIGTHATWRMTRQSLDALLDDTIDKVDRIKERHGRDAELQRTVAAKIAEVEMFGGGQSHLIFAASVTAEERSHRASRVLAVGGVLLGIGVAVGAVMGPLLIAAGTGNNNDGTAFGVGLVSVTVGALLGLAGIITLIVGAVMAASAGSARDEPPPMQPQQQQQTQPPPQQPEPDEGD